MGQGSIQSLLDLLEKNVAQEEAIGEILRDSIEAHRRTEEVLQKLMDLVEQLHARISDLEKNAHRTETGGTE